MKQNLITELSQEEMIQTQGGNPLIGVLVSFAYDVISNWDESVASFKKGYNSVQ